jgi:hypothetical protein
VNLEKGLVAILTGLSPQVKCYARFPQPADLPAVRFQRVYATRTNSIDGSNVGVTEVGLQLDCVGNTYREAKTLADTVREALHGYNGPWGDLTARFVHLQTENDLYDQDGDKTTHWVSQRYQVWTDME